MSEALQSPVKAYAKKWKSRIWSAFLFLADPSYRGYKGPWCAQCGHPWPEPKDADPAFPDTYCPWCNIDDPVAKRLYEESRASYFRNLGSFHGLFAAAKASRWWTTFGLESRPPTREEARKAYGAAMLRAHPDHGGSREQMEKVRRAWERAERDYSA